MSSAGLEMYGKESQRDGTAWTVSEAVAGVKEGRFLLSPRLRIFQRYNDEHTFVSL